MNQATRPAPLPVVFWMIWFFVLAGLIVLQLVIGGGIPTGGGNGEEPLIYQIMGTGMAAAALAVRYILIPRTSGLDKKLRLMIVGLALAESIGILGMLLVPEEHVTSRLFMFGIALACIALSAPVYARSARPGNPFLQNPGSGD